MEDQILEHIKYYSTPKTTYDTFAALFLKKNDTVFQFLENELLSTMKMRYVNL